jgi:hypothetical protein
MVEVVLGAASDYILPFKMIEIELDSATLFTLSALLSLYEPEALVGPFETRKP